MTDPPDGSAWVGRVCATPGAVPYPRDMIRNTKTALVLVAFLVVVMPLPLGGDARTAAGQSSEAPSGADSPLRVATKIAEPFVIERPDGTLGGLSIELWERLAERLGVTYDLEVLELDALLDGVAAGDFDAGIAAISVTRDREARMDMTHGYVMDGLGIAVPSSGGGPTWLRALRRIFTPAFASAVGALALLLFGVGVVVWLVERRRNADDFHGDPVRGIGDGFWFAAVTMTTVGYGDKAPRSLPGRLVALVWMFGSIIVISAFTGGIASALTAASIDTGVRGVEDLRSARVGAPAGSATLSALDDRGTIARPYDSITDGLQALVDGELDAFVHDHSLLRYRIQQDLPGEVRLLDAQFDVGAYAIALPSGSPLREPLNRELLELTRDPAWRQVESRYLGE